MRIPTSKQDKGFTLIELLVVVVIIGILAAIAIPVFLNQRQKAADSATKSDLKNAATVMETYFVDNQTYVGVPTTSFETSKGVTLTVVSPSTTTYCIDATNTNGSSSKFHYNPGNGGLLGGTCAAPTP